MIFVSIILFGLVAGWLAQVVMGESKGIWGVNWGRALRLGVGGSFVGGLLGSLLMGDGLELRASGLIGSAVGAILLIAIERATRKRRRA